MADTVPFTPPSLSPEQQQELDFLRVSAAQGEFINSAVKVEFKLFE